MAKPKYEIRNCKVCGKPHGFCICKPKYIFEYAIEILNEEITSKKKIIAEIKFEINKNAVRDVLFELQQAIEVLQEAGEATSQK